MKACLAEAIFSEGSGSFRISARCLRNGPDLVVLVAGGAAHIGAVALASPGAPVQRLECAGHREGRLAGKMAQAIASALEVSVAVCAGIHFDSISKSGIAEVLAICENLTAQIIAACKSGEWPC